MDEQQDLDLKQNPLWKYIQKVKKRLGPHSTSKMLSIVATVAVVLAIPVTVLVSQQRQNLKQRAAEMQTVTVNKEFVFNGSAQPYFNNDQITPPDGTLGTAIYSDGNNIEGSYFKPATVKRGNTLYVFVIGEGGWSSGKPQGDWYNLFVTSTTDGKTWTAYRSFGGNLSTPVSTILDGNRLYVYGLGYNFDTSGGKTVGPSLNYYILDVDSGRWDSVIPGGTSGTNSSVHYPVDKAQTPSPERAIELNGKQFTFSVVNGKLVGRATGQEQVPVNVSTPPTNTDPVSSNPPTATPVATDTSCNQSGCGRTASRCSRNYGCTRAYYNPATGNSCGEPILETVVYKYDWSCGTIQTNGDDTANTPCHINDDGGKRNDVSTGEDAALSAFYARQTNRSNAYCGNTNTPPVAATATPTPIRTNPVATATPIPNSTKPTPTGFVQACEAPGLKMATRCSFEYACAKATFRTYDNTCYERGDQDKAQPYVGQYTDHFGNQKYTGIDYTSGYDENVDPGRVLCRDQYYQGKPLKRMYTLRGTDFCDEDINDEPRDGRYPPQTTI